MGTFLKSFDTDYPMNYAMPESMVFEDNPESSPIRDRVVSTDAPTNTRIYRTFPQKIPQRYMPEDKTKILCALT